MESNMLEYVKIKKGGMLEAKECAERGIVYSDVTHNVPLYLMRRQCIIEDGVTLRDIFMLVQKHEAYLAPILTQYLKEFLHEGLVEKMSSEMLEKRQSDIDNRHCIEYLEVFHFCEKFKDNEFEHRISFHGAGPYNNPNEPDTKWTTWGVDFLPANHFIDMPVKLNEDFKIMHYRQAEEGDILDHVEVFSDKKSFSLIDVLESIFFEIARSGCPKDRDVFTETVIERLKEAEESMESGDSISHEELTAKLKQKFEEK